jgi:hypothetical protein
MASQIAPLSDTQCRNAKPAAGKVRKLFDGGGLFLHVAPTGAKHWRLKYRFAGKEKLLALGSYPEVTLLQAREARHAAKRNLRENTDPNNQRRIDRLTA